MMKNSTAENLSWLPDAEQNLLLHAALGNNEAAQRAWLEWRRNYSFEKLEHASKRLMPLVYHNLHTFGIEDAMMPQLKQIHRETFRYNQILFGEIKGIIEVLESSGIRTLLLKGAALSLRFYCSSALRSMSDVDLLIETKNIFRAVEILKKNGWQTTQENLPMLTQIIHACGFINHDGRELDLHWNLLPSCWNANKNLTFWESAVPLEFNGSPTLALCATDQLFHVCCHGARANINAPIRWIADAIMILRSSGAEIDWQRLLDLASERRFNVALYLSLKYLKENFAAEVPSEFLRKIAAAPVTNLERMSFRLLSEKPDKPWTFWRYAQELRFKFSSLRSSTTLKPRSLVFIKYLQFALGVESAWQVPSHLFHETFQRFVLRKIKWQKQ